MKGLGDDHWSLAGGLSRVFWVISAISSKMYMNIKKIKCRQEGVANLPRGGEIWHCPLNIFKVLGGQQGS
jgi:hypothetical protein